VRGSLGVWIEPLPDSKTEGPILDLHINVWRDLPGELSAIDFGLSLSKIGDLQRFFLYIPAYISVAEIEDLSEVLKVGHTLSAVFNDSVEITSHHEGSFEVRRSNNTSLRIFHLNRGEHYSVEYVAISEDEQGTVICFSESLCMNLRRLTNAEAYLRFRVRLHGANRRIFSSHDMPADGWLLSRFYKTELNEFRLNERRSFPDVVAKWSSDNSFRLQRVLYFLIRDFRYELLVQHVQFRRTRRLEPLIWKDYLNNSNTPPRSNKDIAERMVIYQWREDARKSSDDSDSKSTKWIEDFSAFAAFKSPKDNIATYIFAIIALGAIGSALQSSVVYALKYISGLLHHSSVESFSRDRADFVFSALALPTIGALLALGIFGWWLHARRQKY
jgi:hypothetical protein